MTEPVETPDVDENGGEKAKGKRRGQAPLLLAKAAARFEKAGRKLERARQRVADAEAASKALTDAEEEYREAKEEFDSLVAAQK